MLEGRGSRKTFLEYKLHAMHLAEEKLSRRTPIARPREVPLHTTDKTLFSFFPKIKSIHPLATPAPSGAAIPETGFALQSFSFSFSSGANVVP